MSNWPHKSIHNKIQVSGKESACKTRFSGWILNLCAYLMQQMGENDFCVVKFNLKTLEISFKATLIYIVWKVSLNF